MPRSLPRTFVRWLRWPAGVRRGAARSRRADAPRALASGLVLFAALTAALGVAAETVRPEWRDPEYGHRLKRVRAYQKSSPDRPLVLVVGSSRAQMGVAPAAMGFGGGPRDPMVYNFGYRGAHPLGMWLQLTRALDDGVKPRAVLVLLATVEHLIDGAADEQFPTWGPRLSAADLRRLAPYTKDPEVHRREVAKARRNPWESRRAYVVSHYLPDWRTDEARYAFESWERMRPDGWVPFPVERLPPNFLEGIQPAVRGAHSNALVGLPPGKASDRALRDLIARCRAEGIAVAVAWAPESPWYRAMYTPAGRAGAAAYARTLTTELGVPVFPAPEHLEEKHFADGYHLTPEGAIAFSQWLADNHLKPWLAEALK